MGSLADNDKLASNRNSLVSALGQGNAGYRGYGVTPGVGGYKAPSLSSFNDIPTLTKALHSQVITVPQYLARSQQIIKQNKPSTLSFLPSALGGAVNKVLIKPAVNTVKAPLDVTSLGAAELTHNNKAITKSTKALTNATLDSYISPLAQTAMMEGANLAAKKIIGNKTLTPTEKNAELQNAVNPAYQKTGFNLNDSSGKTKLKLASLLAQDVATPVLTKGGIGALSKGKSALASALEDARAIPPTPRSALDRLQAPEPVEKPKAMETTTSSPKTVQKSPEVTGTASTPKVLKPLDESGGLPVGDVQKLIEKHNKVVDATGDISGDYAKTQGRTSDIKLDIAKSLKNRTELPSADKQTLQDYRDAKAAGLKPAPLPEHLQAADASITALNRAAQTSDAEKARLSGQPEVAAKIEARNPETYTHRIAQGKGSAVELTARGDRENPLSVGSLSKTTAGSKKQTFLNATDEDGNRTTVAVKGGKITALGDSGKKSIDLGSLNLASNADRLQTELKPTQTKIDSLEREQRILSSTKSRSAAASERLENIKTSLQDAYREHAAITNKYDLNDLDNKTFMGKDGKKYTLGQATQSEITKNAGQKYYVDPELTSHLNYGDSRVALENTRFVEGTKKVLEDKDLAIPEGETAPKGFKPTSNPYFKGYKMDPKLAEVLNDITGKSQDGTHILRSLGKVLRQTIVYLPIKHDFNEAAGFAIDRGLSKWANPLAYVRLGKSLKAGIKEVGTQGPLYRKMLQEGSTLMTADDSQLAKVVSKQVKDLAGDQSRVVAFAKAFGMSPKRAYNALQKVTVWDVQDVLNIARVHERMQGTLFTKPMSFEDALKATERTNFQYKVPSRAALPGVAGRDAAKILKGDATYFGPYTYDKYRIGKNIIKGTLNVKHPVEALRSADQLAATGAIALAVWPLVDKLVQKATGDKNAHVTAPGVAALPELAKQIITHQKTLTSATGSQISVSGPYSLGSQLLNNTDAFNKKPIWDVNASEAQKGKQVSSWLFSQLSPVQKAGAASRNAKTNKVLATALALAGVSTPKNSPVGTRLLSLQYDTLPGVQTQAKAQGKAGNLAGALGTIRAYDAKVLQAAKADLKEQGKPVPNYQTLTAQLKKSGQYYMPKQVTIQNWSKPLKTTAGGFPL